MATGLLQVCRIRSPMKQLTCASIPLSPRLVTSPRPIYPSKRFYDTLTFVSAGKGIEATGANCHYSAHFITVREDPACYCFELERAVVRAPRWWLMRSCQSVPCHSEASIDVFWCCVFPVPAVANAGVVAAPDTHVSFYFMVLWCVWDS